MPAAGTAQLPKSFRRVRLELAREHDHPEGSNAFRYEFAAPLLEDGRIDVEIWKAFKDNCRVIRDRPGEDRVTGNLLRRPGGVWAFHYADEPDETGFRFGEEHFRTGEYVSLDSGKHTFKVVSVEPV